MAVASLVAMVCTAPSATPLFDRLAEVSFINSGTVRSTDSFVWGFTTSGRNISDTAASPKAGSVMYLEKYNVSATSPNAAWEGPWGAPGPFPYLWQRRATTAATTAAATAATASAVTENCGVTSMMHGADMPGRTLHTPAHLRAADTPGECAAICCEYSGCGG